jgi:hypothetical protein
MITKLPRRNGTNTFTFCPQMLGTSSTDSNKSRSECIGCRVRGMRRTFRRDDTRQFVLAKRIIGGELQMSLPSSLLRGAESEKNFTSTIWLTKVLSTEKDCTESAGQTVKKVLFRRRKWPFSSSEKCYFRRNICGSFPGPSTSLYSQAPTRRVAPLRNCSGHCGHLTNELGDERPCVVLSPVSSGPVVRQLVCKKTSWHKLANVY